MYVFLKKTIYILEDDHFITKPIKYTKAAKQIGSDTIISVGDLLSSLSRVTF